MLKLLKLNNYLLKIDKIIFLFTALLLWQCASIKAPPGGPIDETPPTIVSIDPPSGTTILNVRKIRIEFSEYMDENSFNNNIVVFPRLSDPLKYKFKGTRIELILPTKMDSSITYIVQLNRNIKDEHGVPLAKSEFLAYSLGSNISKGAINGKVYSEDPCTIHLWKIDSEERDSIFAQLPDYLADADDSGNYSFEYLADGTYKILAVDKNGSDLPLNTLRSSYALHWKPELEIHNGDTLTNINMRLWKEPQKLELIRAEWSSFKWGEIYFNNPLPDTFDLFLDILQDGLSIDYNYYFNGLDSTSLILSVNDSLVAESVMIKLDSLIFNNEVLIDSSMLEVQIPQTADTSYLQLLNPQSNTSIIPNHFNGDNVDIIFSKPTSISNDSTLTVKLFTNDSIEIPVSILKYSPIHYSLSPIEKWDENKRYMLHFLRDGITTEFGRGLKDSLQVIGFSTKNSMGYGGVIGSINGEKIESIIVELFSVKNPSLSLVTDVNSKSQFEFKLIPEGEYSLRFIKDIDSNMKYNFGRAYQFEPSEWFYFYPDTFEIRANWDTELLPIEIPEVK